MDHHTHSGDTISVGIYAIMASINLIAILDRGLITFVLSCVVSVLAAIYYFKNIRKLNREEKDLNARSKKQIDG